MTAGVITIDHTPLEAAKAVRDWFSRPGVTRSLSERSGTACMYRNSSGMKCALGVLIPDDQYIAGRHEYKDLAQLLDRGLIKFKYPATIAVAATLQQVHDSAVGVDNVQPIIIRARQMLSNYAEPWGDPDAQ